jgi:hypothetical protein
MQKSGKKSKKEILEKMNENLSNLIQQQTPPTPPITEEQLNLPEDPPDEIEMEDIEVKADDEEEKGSVEVEETAVTIATTNLSSWFAQYGVGFDNINRVTAQIRGINSNETLILAVRDPAGGVAEDGHEKRILRLFHNANVQPVLNIPAIFVDVYNIGFHIQHPYENIIIKTYGLRTSLIGIFCHRVAHPDGEKLIPYDITRIKKKDESMEITPPPDLSALAEKLTQPLNKEAAQLLYKQVTKVIDEFDTNLQFIDWLLARQAIITDINHHLQIDNVIISLLQG